MRTRLTARDSRGIIAEIKELERTINADEDTSLPVDEVDDVEDSAGEPMSASERQGLARRLVMMASRLVG